MILRRISFALCLLCSLACSTLAQTQSQTNLSPQTEGTLVLRDGWSLQSSCKVEKAGEVISTPKFMPAGWYAVSVPTTVVAALVKHKVYPDPDFGMNLRTLPGVNYPIGANFSNIPMQQDSPFMVPWWYRKEFVLPESYNGKTIWLNFGGINYRANIFSTENRSRTRTTSPARGGCMRSTFPRLLYRDSRMCWRWKSSRQRRRI